MAMSKSGMAQDVIDALSNVTDQPTAMQKMSKAIKSHIEDNCVISFSWVAMMPPPTSSPDPVTSYKGEVKFPSFLIVMPPLSDPDAAMLALGTTITTNVIGGLIKPKDASFLVPPTNFMSIPIILSLSKATNQKDAMEHLCGEIIDGIKKMINPIPLPGTHASFVVPSPGAIMTGIE